MLRLPFGSKAARRAAAMCLLCAGAAWAQPALTTIQDILYKADGTRFSGLAIVRWNSFISADGSNISAQNLTARVVDGQLRVQLVPTTNALTGATYQVVYNSEGEIQFEETWAVPPSGTALKVKDVRIATAGAAPGGVTASPLTEADITGLTADLEARPVKGPGYSSSRAVAVNETGALETVLGNPADCVRVDGTSGPCGEPAPVFVDSETPGGIVDGTNLTFVLSGNPQPVSSLALYRNGIFQKAAFDFSLSGNSLTFVSGAAPQIGDTLLASYRIGAGGGAAETSARAEVLCSSAGTATTAAASTSLGTCTIPGGALLTGDRVEMRFDFSHEGAAQGFTFEVKWGATSLLLRNGSAGDTAVAGRVEAAVSLGGARVNTQSWGSALAFAADVKSATDSLLANLTIDFRGAMSGTGTDTVTLRNFTVLRYPGRTQP